MGLLPALRFSPRYRAVDFFGVHRAEGALATVIALTGIAWRLSPPRSPACHTDIAVGVGPAGVTLPPAPKRGFG